MKILFITPNDINSTNGGGVNVKKIYLSLKNIKKVELKIYSPSKEVNENIQAIKSKKNDILSRALFHSNYMYMDWKKNKNNIIKYNPDIVILSNSRLGFIAKELKEINPNIKIITQLDNIEFDYCENYVEKFNGIKKHIIKTIEKKTVFRDEKQSFDYSDILIFLTERDRKRSKEIYDYENKKEFIIPICIEKEIELDRISNEKINFVFLGSLWYYPNYSGIKWFVKNVWNKIDHEEFKLIIAGSKPDEELLKLNKKNDIELHPNFGKVCDIIPKNSVFVSPIFEGAGMKVKIAEALAMGVPVIATDESLVGYEEGIKKLTEKGIYRANTAEEFIKSINKINNQYSCENTYEEIKRIFNLYYNLERCKKEILQIIKEI